MSALVTSEFYPNYTADFALLNNLFTKFKPNKIVSTSNDLGLAPNLLRNRTKTVSSNKFQLGEKVQNLFKKKQIESPKPYSLRSALLDNPEQRKIISTVNKQIKAEMPTLSSANRTMFSPAQKGTTQNKTGYKTKSYSSLDEARKNSVKYQAKKAVKENPLRIKSPKERKSYLRNLSINPYYPLMA